MTAVRRSRARRVARWTAVALLVLIGAFLVGRGVVEVLSVDPSTRRAAGRLGWAPSYLGVLAVHAGPGLLTVTVALLWWRRRGRTPRKRPEAPAGTPAGEVLLLRRVPFGR